MSTEIKLGIAAVIIIALVLGGYLGYRSAYDSGMTAGKAEIQTQWDTDKAKIQSVADAAIAQATKEKEAALAANEGITNDLQTQLDSMRGLNIQLAQRLRLAASAATHSGPVSGAANNQKPPTSATDDSVGRLNQLLADALSECRANWANYNALIKEISLQLAP